MFVIRRPGHNGLRVNRKATRRTNPHKRFIVSKSVKTWPRLGLVVVLDHPPVYA